MEKRAIIAENWTPELAQSDKTKTAESQSNAVKPANALDKDFRKIAAELVKDNIAQG